MRTNAFFCLSLISGLLAANISHADVWQNPGLAPNSGNNIHNDSYMSDNYTLPGPTTAATQAEVKQVNFFLSLDLSTKQAAFRGLGECAAQTFDASGHLYTICAGIPVNNTPSKKLLMAFSANLQPLAWHELPSNGSTSLTDFGGGGYFFLDNQYRPVVVQNDGHLVVYQATLGTPLSLGSFTAVRDIDLSGYLPDGDKLYSAMPDKAGYIWWVSSQGIIGTIAPDDSVKRVDLNDPDGDGIRVAADASNFQKIANSLAVDEGDKANGYSGVYIVSTHRLYRFATNADGTPVKRWAAHYQRGTAIKPGQVSQGSGSTPTVFTMAGRRYVAITDNATPMHVNIYRAEVKLGANETRLFAQAVPFATDKSADENSLIAYPTATGVALFAENNYGYSAPQSVGGNLTTEPGFARIEVTPDGAAVSSVNNTISVPSIVSKSNSADGVVYTYEKRTDGYWYLTGLSADDVNQVLFSVKIGNPSENLLEQQYNNHYSALSLGADGSIYYGTVFGITQVKLH
ncbi:hypothetical protein [Methylovulum psychrotolerans]|uniref:Uncharacterized protein n=1 Tax=Methylovulum psychrotolerans TaxID=1704499 RepID=A0A1Z4BXW8_9GAMM|nr:hypothetical protein [Methylovulum psychrotolerans]ASF46128.1 hypothetical protein CEK71_08555 [Methylovulum psychrotolerans]MBT9096667.1 hypothetical protein [Methylovulum psychrotolerans]